MSTRGSVTPMRRRAFGARGGRALVARTCCSLPATSSLKLTRRPSGVRNTLLSCISVAAGTLKWAAAFSASCARTWAAAWRMAVALSCIEWLPAV